MSTSDVMANAPPLLVRALARCRARLERDPRVLGLSIFGSLATGRADSQSDVDLGILIAQDQIEAALADRHLIAEVAPLLACSPCPGEPTCVSALHDLDGELVKVDYNYFTPADQPVWLTLEACVLHDPSGALTTLIGRTPPRGPEPPRTPPEYFWVALWSAVRMLRRGELMEACDILDHLRDPLLTRLLSRIHGLPFQNYRRFEQLYPPEVVRRLRGTFARPIEGEVYEAVRMLAEMYSEVAAQEGENEDTEACRRILEKVVTRNLVEP